MRTGETMAVAFASLEQRLLRDVRQLHDYLWDPTWKGNEAALRTSLLKGARDLDAFLRVGGRLRKNAEKLATPWNREHQGSSLFELLDDTVGLTSAVGLARKGKYREATVRAQSVVESTSIGVCSAARTFSIVEEWEGRKIDFETYTSKLVDVLNSRFIVNPGQFKRMLNAVHDFGADWDGSSSKQEQAMASRAAIDGAAWCVGRSIAIRTMLGEPPKVSEEDFASILETIVARL